MNLSLPTHEPGDVDTILQRHAVRRSNNLPTISVLVGPVGAGIRWWRHRFGSLIMVRQEQFPLHEWLVALAESSDLPVAAARVLAVRGGRDPDDFLAWWRTSTRADRERFWNSLAPDAHDELWHRLSELAINPQPAQSVATMLANFGEPVVSSLAHLIAAEWPSVLFVSDSIGRFSSMASMVTPWALRVPALPLGVVVSPQVWNTFLVTAKESRVKALLKEGELVIPHVDATTAERVLSEIGINQSVAVALARHGTDATLIDAATAAAHAVAQPPQTVEEDDHARSAAERFLFDFLESIPETAGRFELNGTLDFRFGPRPAEIDLLCRTLRIAIEVDGYYHFLQADGYRRDRSKDWELQRRGFIVLRFLAEDIVSQFETVRDRILDAIALRTDGGST